MGWERVGLRRAVDVRSVAPEDEGLRGCGVVDLPCHSSRSRRSCSARPRISSLLHHVLHALWATLIAAGSAMHVELLRPERSLAISNIGVETMCKTLNLKP